MARSAWKEALMLWAGDIICLIVALWLTLFLRYLSVPGSDLLRIHFLPFSLLFVFWTLTFFIAGLYEKKTRLFNIELSVAVFKTQIANVLIAVVFFYFFSFTGIEPRTTLVIYFVVSSILFFCWRFLSEKLIRPFKRDPAIIIGSGEEFLDLSQEIDESSRYSLRFSKVLDTGKLSLVSIEQEIENSLGNGEVAFIVADLHDPRLASLRGLFYKLTERGIGFIDINNLYEDTFDRVPLSLLNREWFLEYFSFTPRGIYDGFKRFMDIFLSVVLGIFSLIFYPIVFFLIKIEDGGPVFIIQKRVGKQGKLINMYKFRSMSGNDQGNYGSLGKTRLSVTRVGFFLRKSRIDELPQLFNVLRGDLSMIGPRPEFPALVAEYEKEIPYYNVRHFITPGLSGWAQIYHKNHPHHGSDTEETKIKLSYDLYYLKHRSLLLDLKIALRTIQTLLSRSGA